ncbi:MAG: RluA family pseudouridine synthase [Spirochaetales bacterium]
MTRQTRRVEVPELDTPQRLDKFLCEALGLFPRTQYERRIVEAFAGRRILKPGVKLSGGEVLQVSWNDLPEVSFGAEDIPLDILYEDETVLVVNKPRGMVVHPAQGNWTGTLVQALLFHVKDLEDQFDEHEARPGIVHRLDKDTTGVLVTAKTPGALESLSAQFRDRTTKKVYYAILKGELRQAEGILDTNVGRDLHHRQRFTVTGPEQGKQAVTRWRVLAKVRGYTLVEFCPQTGRTHQLRVHALHLQCPILGDPVYTRTDSRMPQAPLMLHAASLELRLPGSSVPQIFRAEIPEDFRTVLTSLSLPLPPIAAPD